jgi:hypothetical protein
MNFNSFMKYTPSGNTNFSLPVKKFSVFDEPKDSLPCSQENAIAHYSESDEAVYLSKKY